MKDVFRMRGGYNERWTVFWITAHFLNAAAQFESMGVDLDRLEESLKRKRSNRNSRQDHRTNRMDRRIILKIL
jgi:hypothetical protein